MTRNERNVSPPRRRRWRVGVAVLAVASASCSSSDPGSSAADASGDGSVLTTEGDLFDEVDTGDDQVAASAGDADPDIDPDADPSVTVPRDDASTAGTGVTAAGDSAASDTPATPDDDASETDGGGAPIADENESDGANSGGAVADPDEIDDLDELGDGFAPEVDDIALCRSLARLLSTVQNLAVLESFKDGVAGASGEGAVETVELLVYPRLVDDAATIRADAPEIALEAFGPFLERIEASTDLLRGAGLTAEQIDAAGEEKFPGLDFDVESVDQRIRDAAAAMTDELGSFLSTLEGAESADIDDDRLDTELDASCPVLGASLGNG